MSDTQVINSGWHIIRCEPNAELCVAIALNVRGYEAFCPAEYRPQRTNRLQNGRRVMESRARAMITGYGFVRFEAGQWDFDGVRRLKGVIDFMKVEGKPVGLFDHEVERFKRLDREAIEKHRREMAKKDADEAARAAGKPEVEFEEGKQVRVTGPTGEDWIGQMVQERGAKRVEILRGNVKIIVPHARVREIVAADCE